eukprot:PhF_6_TR37193/c1_g1_i1/m.54807
MCRQLSCGGIKQQPLAVPHHYRFYTQPYSVSKLHSTVETGSVSARSGKEGQSLYSQTTPEPGRFGYDPYAPTTQPRTNGGSMDLKCLGQSTWTAGVCDVSSRGLSQ